ncbi:LAQU0S02e07426g1_1 [Lachancea quebecensis]|uniref:LAQU0S02e07426g1_1 n=1 Tax=Lachancea quebecensis TaxID=1654605 RepID=A0A0P1KN11_9SACH|nr:LAQU0S02e07426g1_1 [Lachancea quebecensis]
MLKFNKKGRTILTSVVFLYVIASFQLSSWKLEKQFFRGFKTLVPTATEGQTLNLKSFKPTNAKGAPVTELRSQLTQQFPYDPSQPIPRRVWQTWKTPFNSPKMSPAFKEYSGRWASAAGEAPLYDYALVPDEHIMPLLRNLYGAVPQIIQAFESMPLNILKADFFRYLVLYARGGIYSDMDTFPLKELDKWPSINKGRLPKPEVPIKYKGFDAASSSLAQEPGFIAGIEADPDRDDWNEWYARRVQFCQWTIQSKPGHPLLRELIINITATTLASTNVKTSIEAPDFIIDEEHRDEYFVNSRGKKRLDPKFSPTQKKTAKNTDGTDTMNWTGPGVFSDAIFNYLNNIIQTNPDIMIINNNLKATSIEDGSGTRKFYRKITEGLMSSATFVTEFFSLIEEPVIVDDVMILPITSFSPGVNHMGSKPEDDDMAFVKHMFKGTWKQDPKPSSKDQPQQE